MIAVKDDVFEKALLAESAMLQSAVRARLKEYADETVSRDGWTLYHWKDIKWYTDSPGYEAIKWIETFIKESPWHGQLLRLGEELGDYEEFGDADDSPFQLGYEGNLTYSY